MKPIEPIMRMAPVIPVLVVDDPAHARPVAEALVAGGLPVLEVTLRTDAALAVIAEMAKVPGAVVGAGTVIDRDGAERARDAGAQFLVSPGLTPRLIETAEAVGLPLLPGVATAGDLLRGIECGLDRFKFFPAQAAGGLPALRALAAPFGQARFCPTGGITAATAPEWLAEPAVLCVGGTWLVPRGAPDPEQIRARAQQAAALSPGRHAGQ